MGSFWRYVKFDQNPAAPGQAVRPGWAIPWSADDLARRHWYEAVQADVTPLKLTPADWRWLREIERPLWRHLSAVEETAPSVLFIYDAIWAGAAGTRLRGLCQNRILIMTLKRWAVAHGWDRGPKGRRFWLSVWRDLQAVKHQAGRQSLVAVRRLTGSPCVIALPADGALASWSSLPLKWRQLIAQTSFERAEQRLIKAAINHWSEPSAWLDVDREVVVSTRGLARWLDGWQALAQALAAAPPKLAEPRQAGWRVIKEYYWHELVRGISLAGLLIRNLPPSEERQLLEKRMRSLPTALTGALIGSVQFDLGLLGGRFHRLSPTWHRRRWSGPWRRLGEAAVTCQQAVSLLEAWGEALLGADWAGWKVMVDHEAQSWLVQPSQRQIIIPAQPTSIPLTVLLPVAAHELTHVWQTIQAGKRSAQSLLIWHWQSGATSALAEAGAMATERAVRRHFGGPDLCRQYFRRGLSARRRGARFGQVMAVIAQGMVTEMGESMLRIPLQERQEIARQAFRRALRLYRPNLPLRPSRRLLNEEQLKYVESDLLAAELARTNVANLLSINSVDLVRWPLYRRLGFDANQITPLPLDHLIEIFDRAVKHLGG